MPERQESRTGRGSEFSRGAGRSAATSGCSVGQNVVALELRELPFRFWEDAHDLRLFRSGKMSLRSSFASFRSRFGNTRTDFCAPVSASGDRDRDLRRRDPVSWSRDRDLPRRDPVSESRSGFTESRSRFTETQWRFTETRSRFTSYCVRWRITPPVPTANTSTDELPQMSRSAALTSGTFAQVAPS